MTFRPHVLVAWGGTLHGVETWTNGLRFLKNTGAAFNDAAAMTFAQDCATDLTNFYSQLFFHTGLKLEYVKVNNIGPDGKYASADSSNTYFLPAAPAGTGGSAHAPQIACVATLLTAAQRGLANKGRLYFGGLAREAFPVDPATGRLPIANRDAFNAHVGTLLTALNNNPGLDAEFGGLDAHVISKGRIAIEGPARKIVGVRTGRVLDTMRSRRSNLAEEYSAVVGVS